MSGERFPPPHGQASYRDAATPADVTPEHDEAERARRIVATRPAEPTTDDVVRVEPPLARPPPTMRIAVAFVALLIVLVSALVLVRAIAPHGAASPVRQLPR